MRFSLVTASICGPGNCPFIKIPWNIQSTKLNTLLQDLKPSSNHFRNQERFFSIQKLQKKQNKKVAVLYLLLNTKRVDITISDFPCNESIRVFTINTIAKKQQENNERSTKSHGVSHFLQTLSCYTLSVAKIIVLVWIC